jgi:hypothetical protein
VVSWDGAVRRHDGGGYRRRACDGGVSKTSLAIWRLERRTDDARDPTVTASQKRLERIR